MEENTMNRTRSAKHVVALMGFVAAIGIWLTPNAFAYDRYYTGQACRSDNYSLYNFHSDGMTSVSEAIDAHCPIGGHQDLTVDWSEAVVWVSDTNSLYDASCSMVTITFTGTVHAGIAESSSGNSGRQPLLFTGSELPRSGTPIDNAIQSYFDCTIKAGINIRGYRVSNSNL